MSTAVSDSPETQVKRTGGPRTQRGKDASRRNSLKLGLRSKIIFPKELEEIIEKRIVDFTAAYNPACDYEKTLVRDMALSTVRVDRCASLMVADLIFAAERAEKEWDTDRFCSVEDLGAKLPGDPARVAQGLLKTRHGNEWLLFRWIMLANIAKQNGCWNEDQHRTACDLQGTPLELRDGDPDMPARDDLAGILALAEEQIAFLEKRIEQLTDMDDTERSMAMAGMPLYEDAVTAKLRKEERRARNDYAKARNELLQHRAGMPASKPKPKPETDRKSVSTVAADYLVKRSEILDKGRLEEVDEFDEIFDELEESPAQVVTGFATVFQEKRPNRRARKAQARRDRLAAKAAGK